MSACVIATTVLATRTDAHATRYAPVTVMVTVPVTAITVHVTATTVLATAITATATAMVTAHVTATRTVRAIATVTAHAIAMHIVSVIVTTQLARAMDMLKRGINVMNDNEVKKEHECCQGAGECKCGGEHDGDSCECGGKCGDKVESDKKNLVQRDVIADIERLVKCAQETILPYNELAYHTIINIVELTVIREAQTNRISATSQVSAKPSADALDIMDKVESDLRED